MQGQITLSKNEKRYQFVYLILMLVAALLFLSVLFLKGFSSPFSSADVLLLEKLDTKARFNERQNMKMKLVDSTFTNITKMNIDPDQENMEFDIQNDINYINDTFINSEYNNINDFRKEGFPQISIFYKMYVDDKKVISKISKDILQFEKQYDDCSIGYKDLKGELRQRSKDIRAKQ